METGVDITEGGSPGVGDEDKIFVALGNVMEENTSILLWALKKFWRKKNFYILHVHQPAQEISILGVKFRAEELDGQQVRAHRESEKKKMHDNLNDYVDICRCAGVHAETIYIEMDTIERGIVELIALHGITKLVMGAAADRHYWKKMAKLRSQKAIFVCQNAQISCNMWFVCKGNLIITREGGLATTTSSSPSPSPLDSPISITGPRNLQKSYSYDDGVGPSNRVDPEDSLLQRAKSSKSDTIGRRSAPSSPVEKSQSQNVRLNPFQKMFRVMSRPRNSTESSGGGREKESSSSPSGEGINAASRIQTPWIRSQSSDERSRLSISSSSSPCESIENQQQDQVVMEDQLPVNSKDLLEVKLESQQVSDSNRMVAEFVVNKVLLAKQQLVDIQKEIDLLRKKREEAEFESLQKPSTSSQFFSVFSALEIESATWSFDPSMKIGEGGFGNVYKGHIRHTEVAIKKFHFHTLEGHSSSDLQREVDVLSKVRHPNLVTLIGASPEASSLVFEYLPNGNLEERLKCKDGTPPLSWKTRIRIAKEICSALMFLHSNQPDSIVHGDLKPPNILLDVNFVSKLGDFGIANFIPRDDQSSSTTLWCTADPMGTIAYVDPEFITTGVLTPKADVYSFGVVVLQLLTGKPAMYLAKKVESALVEGTLDAILDASAGDWPLVEAKQLAQMALSCCEISRKNRPNLELEVWPKLLRLSEFKFGYG